MLTDRKIYPQNEWQPLDCYLKWFTIFHQNINGCDTGIDAQSHFGLINSIWGWRYSSSITISEIYGWCNYYLTAIIYAHMHCTFFCFWIIIIMRVHLMTIAVSVRSFLFGWLLINYEMHASYRVVRWNIHDVGVVNIVHIRFGYLRTTCEHTCQVILNWKHS